jgi:hypothetical protein
LKDPLLVLGWVWAIYLAVRLAVEGARRYFAARSASAVAVARSDEDEFQTPHRRKARLAWTPIPAVLWLAAEGVLAVVAVGAVWLLARDLSINLVPAGLADPPDIRRAAVAAIIGWSLVVINVPVAWRLVGMVLPTEPRRVSGGVDEERMGETIGVLERLLVVVLVPSGGPAAVGFVIAAKTLARFKELDKKRFAERYLLGTMTSVTVALTSTLAAMWIWSSVA